MKANTVAVVTDGTAVLGLGDIGPEAALPVMEGKAVLFKEFGGVDAVPVCLRVSSADELVSAVQRMEPMFGGINLEDIAAPRCFEVERRLVEALSIPVFHDDQHGTAVVVLAACATRQGGGQGVTRLRVVLSGRRGGRGGHHPGSSSGRRRGHRGRRPQGDPPGSRGPRPVQAVAGRLRQSQRAVRLVAGSLAGRRRVHRGERAGSAAPRRPGDHGRAQHRFALANPVPEVRPRRGCGRGRRDGDRPQRLPQPDQQRPLLSRNVPLARSTREPPESPNT